MNARPISISTLSPVHVGCDDVYEPSNFVIANGLLHALEPADLAADLSENDRNQLSALAEGHEPIAALQRFFRKNAQRFAALSHHQVTVAEAIVGEYEKTAGKATQRGAAGEATYNLFPIARTAYRPFDAAAYLPGSSLKGSIRTAWLNHCNEGKPLNQDERRDKGNNSRRLQERLLGYKAGKFEDDPFRHIGIADAHSEEGSAPPPTRVLYAISKKKKQPREGERAPRSPKVFLETVPEALPDVFLSELRLDDKRGGNIDWNSLCDACNKFYKPQLEAELNHAVLGKLMDTGWKKLLTDLLGEELNELIADQQGFLSRVGRHSGAESVTLDGLRDIKILGKKGEQPSYRSNTTEKRFASQTKTGAANLLPFGWIWIESCDDAHRHLSERMRQKLATHSASILEEHRDRLVRREENLQQRAVAAARAAERKEAEALAARLQAEAAAAKAAALAALSANLQRVEQFKADFGERQQQLLGKRDNPNTQYHDKARSLARDAVDWSAEEKLAAAEAIEYWLPLVVRVDLKDERKKLKLSALRGLT